MLFYLLVEAADAPEKFVSLGRDQVQPVKQLVVGTHPQQMIILIYSQEEATGRQEASRAQAARVS